MLKNCGIVRVMNNFKDGGFKKKGTNFGGKPKFGGGGRGDRSGRGGGNRSEDNNFGGHKSGGRSHEMFKAECSKCQKTCSLPFRPSNDKPVFCSDCFAKKSFDNDRGEGPQRKDRGNRNEHNKAPRDQRSPRHDRPQAHLNKEMAEMKRQLETIESRLNRILDIMNPAMKPVKTVEATRVEKTVQTKVSTKRESPNPVKKAATKKAAPVKKASKKEVAKPVKKVVKKVVKKAVKPVAKKTAKKVVKKAVVKKVAKKAVKKVVKTKK
jgi:CxxC-x17-CxxC domain-containing protein